MATVTKPIALDESLNTTELSPRNIADVLADELGAIAGAISRIAPQTVYDELDKLEDVDISSPTNGQILKYNSVSQKWENGNESGGGGDTVTWTQIVGSGTKIAEIDINGTSTDVYAPSGGSGTISLIVTCDSALEGETLTLTGGSVLTAVVPAGLVVTFTVPNLGTWVLTNSLTSDSQSITMDYYGNYYATITSIPDGSTVTPTDDVLIWQKCGATGTTYATISDVLNDTATLIALMSSDNACDYLVRSTTWTSAITTSIDAMKAIGASDYCSNTLLSDNTWNTAIQNSTYFEYVDNAKVPTMTSNTTPEGVVIFSSEDATYKAWKAFDNDASIPWATTSYSYPAYIGYGFTIQEVIKKVTWNCSTNGGHSKTKTYKIQGSNDNSTWVDIENGVQPDASSPTDYAINIDNATAYLYYRFYIVDGYHTGANVGLNELQFYGRTIGGVQTWLRSAGITNKTYTTLAEVLADSTTLSALMADYNAVDYLVTAKAWVYTITADSTAMSYIGLNNYASDTLLNDATWCNAICGSAYKTSVLNYKNPTMTSNTTPSGVASASGVFQNQAQYYAYKALDNSTSTTWIGIADSVSGWLKYDFGSAKEIYYMRINKQVNVAPKNVKVQGSNDDSTYVDLTSVITIENTTDWQDLLINNNPTAYRYYKLVISDSYSTQPYVREWEFYGREDV